MESELSFSNGNFLNNNDVRDRKPIFSDRFDCTKTTKRTWDTIVQTTILDHKNAAFVCYLNSKHNLNSSLNGSANQRDITKVLAVHIGLTWHYYSLNL